MEQARGRLLFVPGDLLEGMKIFTKDANEEFSLL
jgi:hypothetical protein